jgi:GDPmannose 4,6-dehydratase
VNYREGYGIFAVNGILFNHESPRRSETFVTRKITHAVAEIAAGRREVLPLGNLQAKRDWGYAPEYVEAMWMMLQRPAPEDFVIGTGEEHSVEEFLREAFEYAGLGDWRAAVRTDPRYFRPTEVERLRADARKAERELGWKPRVRFRELVRIMVDADFRRLGLTPPGEGDRILKEKFPDRWWKTD